MLGTVHQAPTFVQRPKSQASSSRRSAQQGICAHDNAHICAGQGCQVADGVSHIHAALEPCSGPYWVRRGLWAEPAVCQQLDEV